MLGIVGVIILMYLVLRTFVQSQPADPRAPGRARKIVRAWGDDTLDYFALRRDKNYYFSTDGRSLVAYVYVRGTAMVAGDPIGPPEDTAKTSTSSSRSARAAAGGWRSSRCARPTPRSTAPAECTRSTWATRRSCAAASSTSRAREMKAVRSAVRRIDRDHDFELISEPEANPELIAELNEISAEWRKGAPERGFTMELGQDVEGTEPDFVIALARERNGRIGGFLRFVPVTATGPGTRWT